MGADAGDDQQTTVRRVADAVAPAVVRIGRGGGRGCGLVVGEGLVATNAHNLRDRTTETMKDTVSQVKSKAGHLTGGVVDKAQGLKHKGQDLLVEKLDRAVEAVEAAVRGDGVIDHRPRVGLLRDVGADERGGAAVGRDEVDGLPAGRLAVLGDDDLRPFGGEHPRCHAPHAPAGARDDRDLVGESHRCPSLFVAKWAAMVPAAGGAVRARWRVP